MYLLPNAILIYNKKLYLKVSYPASGQLALDLMCGEWGALECSASKWFHFMGNPEDNQFVPFLINYVGTPNTNPINGLTPHDPKIVPCYEALNVCSNFFYSRITFGLKCNVYRFI